jgi:hypothetical protein
VEAGSLKENASTQKTRVVLMQSEPGRVSLGFAMLTLWTSAARRLASLIARPPSEAEEKGT